MARIDVVREKLAASLDGSGKPLKGYTLRVAACRGELAQLEAAERAAALRVDTPADPA